MEIEFRNRNHEVIERTSVRYPLPVSPGDVVALPGGGDGILVLHTIHIFDEINFDSSVQRMAIILDLK